MASASEDCRVVQFCAVSCAECRPYGVLLQKGNGELGDDVTGLIVSAFKQPMFSFSL